MTLSYRPVHTEPLLAENIAEWQYNELDPDVFHEELDRDVYRSAERIAVVAVDVRMR